MSTTSLSAMVLCILLCTLATWLPRLLPLYVFSKDLPSWLKDPRELNIEFSPFERCSQLQNYQFTMRFNVLRSPEATFLGLHDHIQNTVLSFKSLY